MLISKLIIDNSMDPSNAAKNPDTIKPGTILPTSQNRRALIIKVNNPKVSKLTGRVKSSIRGFMKIFIRPIATAAHKAGTNPAKLIPGTAHATKNNDKANSTNLIMEPIILFSFVL